MSVDAGASGVACVGRALQAIIASHHGVDAGAGVGVAFVDSARVTVNAVGRGDDASESTVADGGRALVRGSASEVLFFASTGCANFPTAFVSGFTFEIAGANARSRVARVVI